MHRGCLKLPIALAFPFVRANVLLLREDLLVCIVLYKIRKSELPRNPGEKQEGCISFAFLEVIISKPQLVVIER